jgi:transporter family protein
MSSQTIAIIIGGIFPAVVFGLTNAMVKASTEKGISIPFYIICTGGATLLTGLVLLFVMRDMKITMASGGYAIAAGVMWAVAISGILIALQRYNASVSILAPLYNTNTLITVALGLWLFSEWQTVRVPQLLIGSLLIVIGGGIVARA